MTLLKNISCLLLPAFAQAATVNYTIPSTAAASAAKLAPAPVGLSFEFFAYPSYFTNVTATNQCLANFKDLSGTWPPIRIGGTTQYVISKSQRLSELMEINRDRATYDTNTSAYVVYSVNSSVDAPASLTFGPNLMKLASTYPGTVVLGLNRGHNDITNTIAAAKSAKGSMGNLKAIELGNEPEYYTSDGQPIASPSWTPAIDAASQNNWDFQVGTALQSTNIIQAGNSNASPPTWGAAELIARGNATVRTYVKDYAHHNYPGGTLQNLMSHSGIVSNLAPIGTDGKAANAVGKEYVLGETNSVSGGGAATVSPTFGAALWTLDYTLQATIDSGSSNYGIYVLYNSDKAPIKAVLINSDYYAGTGTRGSETFVLGGLTVGKGTKAKRLTAGSALSRVDQGSNPSFGGQIVANGTCVIGGTETFETGTVEITGTASFTVAASEALLVYF
ncbi:hypothetical protein BPOR_0782g00010 [Botrytis porri]|uniref:Beta-glucuronidase C-terminal domain-containing protein n=1 Tax=Botrytis porri TaxID=87229 RepID=A0A4Z1K997_9HELO|nr:hypothetical protein BPOR_0782g00010 [Botrytis porri]